MRTILGRDDISVISSTAQKTIVNPHGKSARLDILVEDQKHNVYNVEVQRAKAGASPKRARLNASLTDSDTIKKGTEYNDITDVFVIFITESDYFGQNKATYVFDRRTEDGIELGDGSHIIYVNGKYKGEDAIGTLIHDMHCTRPEDIINLALRKRVGYVKGNSEEMEKMIDSYDEWGDKRWNEGRKEVQKEAVEILMKDFGLTFEEACDKMHVSSDQRESLRQEFSK